jgi:hypothetical protein
MSKITTMHGIPVKAKRIPDDLVLFRTKNPGERVHTYHRTYAKRLFISGKRKFVIWAGMICWLRDAYRGHYVVWTQEPIGA